MPVINQRVAQLGTAAVWGTSTAPTVELAGITALSMPPSIVTEANPDILSGVLGPARHIVKTRHESHGVTVGGQLILEQEMYFFDGADQATPGGAGPYTYTYTGPTTAAATPRLQTLVGGAANGVWGLNSAVLETYGLSWRWGEIVEMTSTWLGYEVEDDALAALTEATDANTTEATACMVNTYIDAYGGAYGATAMTKTLSATMDLDLTRQYLPYVGSCNPGGVFDARGWIASGNVSLQQDATSAAFADAAVGDVLRKKIRFDITNGGATTAERSLEIDMYVELTIEELFSDADGLLTLDFSYETRRDGADSDFYFEAVLTNNTAVAY